MKNLGSKKQTHPHNHEITIPQQSIQLQFDYGSISEYESY